jgi:8-oxo-dGTP pyrophosphatase MutT (NUDIX family)/GNAT superfamily N-acetyltransferase
MKAHRNRVSIVIIHDKKILGFHAEDPHNKKKYFFLPGGLLEEGENASQAACRETLEETGYAVEVIGGINVKRRYDFEWNDIVNDCETQFLAGRLTSEVPLPVNDATYHHGVDWVPVGEVESVFNYQIDILGPIKVIAGSWLKAVDGIDYYSGRQLGPKAVADLYDDAGLKRPTNDIDRIGKMYSKSNLVISAWNRDELVGVSRSLSDFSYCCYLSDLAVKKYYQNRGIGKKLIELTKEQVGPESMLLLLSAPDAMEYYPKVGFEAVQNGFMVKRSK